MFKSIEYANVNKTALELCDTSFVCLLVVPNTPAKIHREVLVFCEYKRRNRAIAKNMALLYHSYGALSSSALKVWIIDNGKLIDQLFPEFQYGAKHQACVIRQALELHNQRGRR